MRVYHAIYAVEVHTYRSIIHQGNVHHGCEYAIFDFFRLVQILNLLEEGPVKLLGLDSACRLVEVWLIAFLCRGEKGKLRH